MKQKQVEEMTTDELIKEFKKIMKELRSRLKCLE